MLDSLLKALQDNLSDTQDGPRYHDASSLPGLAGMLRGWLAGEVDEAQAEEALHDMRSTLEHVLADSRRDLEQDLDPGLAEPLELLCEAYERALEVVGALQESEPGQVEQLSALLEEEAGQIRTLRRTLEEWLHAPVPRCHGCGSRGDGPCPACKLERLLPDAESELEESQQTVQLGQEYVRVYQAYQQVVSGRCSILALQAPVNALDAMLSQVKRLIPQLARRDTAEIAERVEAATDTCLSGLARMARAQTSLRARDLNAGWRLVFEGAVALRDELPLLMQATGQDARPVEEARHWEDSVRIQ